MSRSTVVQGVEEVKEPRILEGERWWPRTGERLGVPGARGTRVALAGDWKISVGWTREAVGGGRGKSVARVMGFLIVLGGGALKEELEGR